MPLLPPLRAGLGTAWVNRGGGRYPDHFSPADLEVASLTELAERLCGPDAVED